MASEASLTAVISEAATWNIKVPGQCAHHNYSPPVQVSQLLCSSPSRPPEGCLQYHTGIAGQVNNRGRHSDLHHNLVQVRSFNFFATTYNHLADQYYKVEPSLHYTEVIDIFQVCIRREQGYCRIAWTASSDPDSFKVCGPS